jgi:hypothetical protein
MRNCNLSPDLLQAHGHQALLETAALSIQIHFYSYFKEHGASAEK